MFLDMVIFINQKIINTSCLEDTSCFAMYKMGVVKQIDIKN